MTHDRNPYEWVASGQTVELRDAANGEVHAVGRAIALADQPTITIETADGQHISWLVSLAHLSTTPATTAPAPHQPANHAEAIQLWDSLELRPNQHVTDAVMIAKVSDFTDGSTTLAIADTDGVDWITRLGILHASLAILTQGEYVTDDEDDTGP